MNYLHKIDLNTSPLASHYVPRPFLFTIIERGKKTLRSFLYEHAYESPAAVAACSLRSAAISFTVLSGIIFPAIIKRANKVSASC